MPCGPPPPPVFSLFFLSTDSEAGILCQIILIIARLGSSFLNHEPRGVRTIVEAMARHRSDRELQKTAVRALFTLAKEPFLMVPIYTQVYIYICYT